MSYLSNTSDVPDELINSLKFLIFEKTSIDGQNSL